MTSLVLSDDRATTALGRAIAPWLARGEALLLYGSLGMGKSTLARGLIRALAGEDEDVPSPTFTLVQVYDTTPPVAHFDLYRLARREEAFEIGLDEALDVGVALVEWPERLGPEPMRAVGPDVLTVTLQERGEGRHATVSGAGTWASKLQFVVDSLPAGPNV